MPQRALRKETAALCVAISVVTLCELHHGVLIADDETRAGRLDALVVTERTFEARPSTPASHRTTAGSWPTPAAVAVPARRSPTP